MHGSQQGARAVLASNKEPPTDRASNRLVRRRKLRKSFLRDRYMYLLIIPGVLVLVLFRYVPMGGLVIGFKDYNIYQGIWDSPWVGVKHFIGLFTSVDFWRILRNTLLISLYKIWFGFPVPIFLAILLSEVRSVRFQKGVQTAIYLPHFISWVVIGGLMRSLLSPSYGIVKTIADLIGTEPVNILGSRQYFRAVLVVSTIWKDAGWGTIIYFAAISQIDPNLYEASIMDGAGKWRQVRSITLPSIYGVIVLLLTIRIGFLMDAGFEQILVLQNPLVRDVSDIFDTYVYRVGLGLGRYSFAAALGFFKSVVALILITSANLLARALGQEGLI